MDEIYKHAFRVCVIWDAQAFQLMNYCGFNIEPFCSDVCGDHRRPQILAEICRNMGICCGFRAVAARGKFPGFMLLNNRRQARTIEDKNKVDALLSPLTTLCYPFKCFSCRYLGPITVTSCRDSKSFTSLWVPGTHRPWSTWVPEHWEWVPSLMFLYLLEILRFVPRTQVVSSWFDGYMMQDVVISESLVMMSTMVSQITSLTIVYSTAYSCADPRKHQSSTSLAFVREIHRRPVNSLHKGPVTQKIFTFDDVIMLNCACHHHCH